MTETTEGPKIGDMPEATELLHVAGAHVVLPEKPWMPTHAGIEIRIEDPAASGIIGTHIGNTADSVRELIKAARVGVLGAEMAKIFSEADDPENPDWYDKPWFNLNINSQLGNDRFDHLVAQVYLRARTLGQTEGMKGRREYDHTSNFWSNPYWTVPIPVDDPLNPDDRRPYDRDVKERIQKRIQSYAASGRAQEVLKTSLFVEEDGKNSLDTTFPFQIGKGNYPVWQMGDYLIVTQDNPLVDRKDGVHMVLIYRGEQQDESRRYSFLWRDPRRIAEMTAIAAATSRVVSAHGYAGNTFDKSYLHMNANWSLDFALPEKEHDPIMDKGSVGPGKWPGPKDSQTVPGPNAHPHIQLLKPGHSFDLALSPRLHQKRIKDRQTDDEIASLQDLLHQRLTPLVVALQGKTLSEIV